MPPVEPADSSAAQPIDESEYYEPYDENYQSFEEQIEARQTKRNKSMIMILVGVITIAVIGLCVWLFASVGDKEEETAETTEVVADTAAAPAVDTAPAAPAPAVEAAKEEVKKEETPKAETKTEAAKEDKTKSAAAEKSTKKSAAKSEKKAAAAPAPKKEKAAPAQAAPKNSGQSYGKKERSKSIPDF